MNRRFVIRIARERFMSSKLGNVRSSLKSKYVSIMQMQLTTESVQPM